MVEPDITSSSVTDVTEKGNTSIFYNTRTIYMCHILTVPIWFSGWISSAFDPIFAQAKYNLIK